MQLRRLSIIGVGLLGGSIGLAARSALKSVKITGYGHRPQTLRRAREIGAIDEECADLTQAVNEADLTILCTPVGLFSEMLAKMSQGLKPGAIVTDVGSTKESVVREADKLLPKNIYFVGSHPMAGSEKRGVEFARADLFQNALCILTPTRTTDPDALKTVQDLWQALGMRLHQMSPADHDLALAQVSHLPHAMAAALVSMQSPQAIELAGKGFLDTTRIASGDGTLWRDIFHDNAPNMRKALAQLRAALDCFESLLDPAKASELRDWLDAQAQVRQRLLAQKFRELTPD